MKTMVIGHRVVDFLKQYPPFQSLDPESLLALAAQGRVKFFESGGYIYWQDRSPGEFVYAIQQGTVSLWEHEGEDERLRDMRGEGDMINLDRFLGLQKTSHSARANSDVLLYALPFDGLLPLIEGSEPAARYIRSHAAAEVDFGSAGQNKPVHETFLIDLARPDPLVCSPALSIAEVIRRMHEKGVDAVCLEDGGCHGIVTPDVVWSWLGEPDRDLNATAASLPLPGTRTLAPEATVSDGVLAMGEASADAILLTRDGSAGSEILSLVTAADLSPVFTDHPVTILRDISRARSTESLKRLHLRAQAFVLTQLSDPPAIEWLARFSDQVKRAIFRQVLRLAQTPLHDRCWCFFGSSGRHEALTADMPGIALIFGNQEAAKAYVEDRAHVVDLLAQCGYRQRSVYAEAAPLFGTLDEWKARFGAWIDDPIRNRLYLARPLFDLSPVAGRADFFEQVESQVNVDLGLSRTFLQLLAHDCLADLPPLTFFHDLVVHEGGEEAAVFHLDRDALKPVVSVGRVFGAAVRNLLNTSTAGRFTLARQALPDHQRIFRDAAETARILLFYQAQSGLRKQDAGHELAPAQLSRYDRQVLRGAFRSIHRLLEFTAGWKWLEQLP